MVLVGTATGISGSLHSHSVLLVAADLVVAAVVVAAATGPRYEA